jgi:aryl-alcohol dehydrogenase-like predicted oxidoreductase
MISKQAFGRTGHASTRVIFGSYALSQATQSEADRVLDVLLEYGINHIDTAHSYGNAEKRIGPWMAHHRQDFFLATKTGKRGYKDAWKELNISLDLLRTDHIDLWQMHGLTNPHGWEKAMGEGGALEALLEAREKGLVRFLGVTGHGTKVPEMHLRSLERFNFDSVLLPYNFTQVQDPRYAANFAKLVEVCHQNKIALQTTKSLGMRQWGDRAKTYNTYFYQPLEEQAAIDKAVHWVLGHPDIFLISVGDMQLLPRVLQAANRFESRPSDDEMRALVCEYEMTPVFT